MNGYDDNDDDGYKIDLEKPAPTP